MIALIQRVTEARVRVGGDVVGEVGRGLLALVGVAKGDDEAKADRLLERLLGYRVFPDGDGRMNLSLRDVGGALLLVSQFTLVADTRKGMRPSFSSGAPPDEGRRLFDHLVRSARDSHCHVAAGVYAADMKVELINDGPVTFWLES